MPAVPRHLILADLLRTDERQTVVLPFGESAAHRVDVVVAQILECFRRESRPRSGGAINDNRLTLVGQYFVSLHFEETAGQENRLIERPLFPFIAFANVQ